MLLNGISGRTIKPIYDLYCAWISSILLNFINYTTHEFIKIKKNTEEVSSLYDKRRRRFRRLINSLC